MSETPRDFSHFINTRPRHGRWVIIGVQDPAAPDRVESVEVYQGDDGNTPRLVLAPEDVPQFVAGLVATITPGDLTAEGPQDDATE